MKNEQLTLILDAHEKSVGLQFMHEASQAVIRHLKTVAESSSEDIVDACKAAFIRPREDRAFGAIFAKLSRTGVIQKAGYCQRRKGHACAGGIIWRLAI
jgi:hypothetical protein